jgi:glycosyltransferase involved in cell wall biosynthesis
MISICIPAYKRLPYLKRLLGSIEGQSYKNFEVVITDDSGDDDEVHKFISSSNFNFSITYIKNEQPLGSPKNWLESFKHAKGEWIKIMHDDDYFFSPSSLNGFVNAVDEKVDCVFSGYQSVYDNGIRKNMTISSSRFYNFTKDPFILFSNNIIGPPSVMMFRSSIKEQFDERLKWIVDWEYYIRLAIKYKLVYVHEPLICVSYNDSQITNFVKGDPSVEIPEYLIFYNKYNSTMLKDIYIYDSWWRLLRNLRIRTIEEFKSYYSGHVPIFIFQIIKLQALLNYRVLKIGAISKLFMFYSYMIFRLKFSTKV